MPEVLYRKWRPRSFAELAGQEHVATTLTQRAGSRAASPTPTCSPGPRGTGKTTTGRLLAKALNCTAPPRRRALQRVRVVPRLPRRPRAGPDRDGRREQPRHRRDPQPARQGGDFARRRRVQGLPHRRSAHADGRGVQRAAQDAGGAAAARRLHPGDDRGAQGAGDDHLALPALRLPPHAARRARRRLQRICDGEGITLRAGGAGADRARRPPAACATPSTCSTSWRPPTATSCTLEHVRAGLGLDRRRARPASWRAWRWRATSAGGLELIASVRDDGLDLRQFQRELVDELRALLMVKSGLEPADGATHERQQRAAQPRSKASAVTAVIDRAEGLRRGGPQAGPELDPAAGHRPGRVRCSSRSAGAGHGTRARRAVRQAPPRRRRHAGCAARRPAEPAPAVDHSRRRPLPSAVPPTDAGRTTPGGSGRRGAPSRSRAPRRREAASRLSATWKRPGSRCSAIYDADAGSRRAFRRL